MEVQPGCSYNWRLPQREEDSSDDESPHRMHWVDEGATGGLDIITQSLEEPSVVLGSIRRTNNLDPLPDNYPCVLSDRLMVVPRYLCVETELKRRRGESIDHLDDNRRRRVFIVPIPPNLDLRNIGFRMNLMGREDDYSVFAYDHLDNYKRMHQEFLNRTNPADKDTLEELQKKIHIEGLLESADYIIRADEYRAANILYEQIIVYLQSAFHSAFNLTDQSIKLPYCYLENRPFHVAVFKYLHLISAEGYHRTALELAKLLINLDSTDPLAMTFIIDSLALKAREYRWLIDFISDWTKKNYSYYYFNFKMSNALAHFILAKKSRATNFGLPDALLQEAITEYPWVAVEMLNALSITLDTEQQRRSLFGRCFLLNSRQRKFERSDPFLDLAIRTYARIAASKWNKPTIINWLMRNVHTVVSKFDNNPAYKKCVEEVVQNVADAMGEACPVSIRRYLILLKPMSKLITCYGDLDFELAHLTPNRPWDPSPPLNSVNRFQYKMTDIDPRHYSVIFDLLSRTVPTIVPSEMMNAKRNDVAIENATGRSIFNQDVATFVADILRNTCLVDDEGYIPNRWDLTPHY